mmetsp:Transcript_75561/g.179531  ORF Transcript_75561/g.179531 Transcript_75561/m.179531 type:complete len:433 (-) Transcript_75561:40-1338(-)
MSEWRSCFGRRASWCEDDIDKVARQVLLALPKRLVSTVESHHYHGQSVVNYASDRAAREVDIVRNLWLMEAFAPVIGCKVYTNYWYGDVILKLDSLLRGGLLVSKQFGKMDQALTEGGKLKALFTKLRRLSTQSVAAKSTSILRLKLMVKSRSEDVASSASTDTPPTSSTVSRLSSVESMASASACEDELQDDVSKALWPMEEDDPYLASDAQLPSGASEETLPDVDATAVGVANMQLDPLEQYGGYTEAEWLAWLDAESKKAPASDAATGANVCEAQLEPVVPADYEFRNKKKNKDQTSPSSNKKNGKKGTSSSSKQKGKKVRSQSLKKVKSKNVKATAGAKVPAALPPKDAAVPPKENSPDEFKRMVPQGFGTLQHVVPKSLWTARIGGSKPASRSRSYGSASGKTSAECAVECLKWLWEQYGQPFPYTV